MKASERQGNKAKQTEQEFSSALKPAMQNSFVFLTQLLLNIFVYVWEGGNSFDTNNTFRSIRGGMKNCNTFLPGHFLLNWRGKKQYSSPF